MKKTYLLSKHADKSDGLTPSYLKNAAVFRVVLNSFIPTTDTQQEIQKSPLQ